MPRKRKVTEGTGTPESGPNASPEAPAKTGRTSRSAKSSSGKVTAGKVGSGRPKAGAPQEPQGIPTPPVKPHIIEAPTQAPPLETKRPEPPSAPRLGSTTMWEKAESKPAPAAARLPETQPRIASSHPTPASARPLEPRPVATTPGESRVVGPKPEEFRPAPPKSAEPRMAEPKPPASRLEEPKPVESKPAMTDPAEAALSSAVSLHEQIALLAYSYWEAGGRKHGHSQEDWFRAEREILSRVRGSGAEH